jgi:cytochrome c-type biogenesis protein CcmF
MFIGALVLFFSSLLITGATSLPVYNKVVQLFKPDFVGTVLEDPVAHHNRYQLWIAVFMGVLTGVGQFMRYRGVGGAAWLRTVGIHLGLAALLSALLTYLNALWIQVQAWQLYVLLFAALFAVVSSMDYLVLVARGNLRLAASAISHFGFGILIVGILSTGLNKTWISSNAFAMEGLIEGMGRGEGEKNILLMKDAPMPIKAGYEALYVADTVVRQTRTFTVRFRQRDASGNFTKDSFTLHPNVMYDRQFSKVVASNPSTQHYWDRDIFTHISSLPKSELDPEFARQQDDSLQFINYAGRIGDTVFTQNNYLIIKDITKKPRHPDYLPEAEDLAFGIQFEVHRPDDSNVYRAMPIMYLRPGKGAFALPAAVGPAQMKIRLTEATMDRIFQTEEALQYRSFSLTEGGSFRFNNCSIRLVKLDRNATHVGYTPQADDIAVGARLEITPDGEAPVTACPLYLIRENRPYSLKDEVAALGLHLRFEQILPQTGTLVIAAAQADNAMRTLPFEVAENATRSDYIVLEAIIFPGINLVWIGSLAMLLGLGLAWWNKNRQRL